jgi:ferritin-like protein
MNLTPEQKAQELVDKFKYNTRAFNETNGWEDTCYNAKQCALINVNEMYNMASGLDNVKYMNYLTDVKTEIEKL